MHLACTVKCLMSRSDRFQIFFKFLFTFSIFDNCDGDCQNIPVLLLEDCKYFAWQWWPESSAPVSPGKYCRVVVLSGRRSQSQHTGADSNTQCQSVQTLSSHLNIVKYCQQSCVWIESSNCVDLKKLALFWCFEATQRLLNIDESYFQDYHTWYSLQRFTKTKLFETCLIYFDKKSKSLLKVLQMITFLIIASKWLLINW